MSGTTGTRPVSDLTSMFTSGKVPALISAGGKPLAACGRSASQVIKTRCRCPQKRHRLGLAGKHTIKSLEISDSFLPLDQKGTGPPAGEFSLLLFGENHVHQIRIIFVERITISFQSPLSLSWCTKTIALPAFHHVSHNAKEKFGDQTSAV